MARLGDIATVITKGTTPTSLGFNFQTDGVNFIKIESIDENGKFICEKFDHINEACHEKLKRSQLQENDILFSIAGAIGRTAVVTKEILPANTNQALAIIRIPQGKINYSFLLYILQSTVVMEQAEKKKQGVAQLNLSLKDIGDLIIPDIPIEKQQEIVNNLNNVSNLILLRKQQLSKLDELVKARFVELFGDPVTNEKNWPRMTLGDICEIGSSKRVFEKDYVPSGIPFFRTKEIVELSKGNPISTELFITEEHFAELKKSYGAPKKDDLLISAVGTIGTIWIVSGDFEFYFKDGNLIQIKSSPTFNSIFMKYLLDELIANYKKEMSTGTAYSALTIVGLKKMLVYDVPLDFQEKFADFVKQIDKSKFEVQQSLEKLETLKKSLMQQYFG